MVPMCSGNKYALGKISSYDSLADELILWCTYCILILLVCRFLWFRRIWMRVRNLFHSCLQEVLENNSFCLRNSQTYLRERSSTNLWFCVPEFNTRTVNFRFEKSNIHARSLFGYGRVHINLLFAPLQWSSVLISWNNQPPEICKLIPVLSNPDPNSGTVNSLTPSKTIKYWL